MHEVGIASSIIESIEAEARRRPDAQFTAVGVRIGELSNVDRDALAFAFEALTGRLRWSTCGLKLSGVRGARSASRAARNSW